MPKSNAPQEGLKINCTWRSDSKSSVLFLLISLLKMILIQSNLNLQ